MKAHPALFEGEGREGPEAYLGGGGHWAMAPLWEKKCCLT